MVESVASHAAPPGSWVIFRNVRSLEFAVDFSMQLLRVRMFVSVARALACARAENFNRQEKSTEGAVRMAVNSSDL